ncbi:hypothetical protein [Variovorax sp. PBL-E5]|uniref:hypothetical protein n=1 Tax=Variovorax sp. PBL-E5 TaxID=434014 RepID=UPI001315E7F5|nr:hypothetical protein [Variovorax sp. PBL-E5]VTU27533.1 hypothetical protein E5CHR_02423 [Variovorax sp. PBL-E5]
METFVHGATRYLVVPQLARDVAGQPARMTLGDSDVDALIYRWQDGRFVEHARIAVPGGEDAAAIALADRVKPRAADA